MDKLSPMMTHYKQLKEKYPDTIIFYRLGDFYEMFFDDAILASEILDLTLTGRDCGLSERAPMCGVPYHAVEGYIAKLIKAGQKVAICEQLTNPGDQKGLVERDVIKVITAGTLTEESMLEENANNYLACVYLADNAFSIAWCDISTGEFKVFEQKGKDLNAIEQHLLRIAPSEIIGNTAFADNRNKINIFNGNKSVFFQHFNDLSFDFDTAQKAVLTHTGVYDVKVFGLDKKRYSVCASGALIEYIYTTQKTALGHIKNILYVNQSDFMLLDYNCKRNLELTRSVYREDNRGTLLWVLDHTCTNMGARELKKAIEEPLQSPQKINERLDAVQELIAYAQLREELTFYLKQIKDIERLASKIALGSLKPRDCISIAVSLDQIPKIKGLLSSFRSSLLSTFAAGLQPLEDVCKELFAAIAENPPAQLKDGGFIAAGYNELLDSYRDAQNKGKQWIAEYEANEKARTGIKLLKIGYNRVFGYYIELPNSQLSLAPYSYHRKQTLSTGERFITDELKAVEEKILGASEKAVALEQELYANLTDSLKEYIGPLQQNARIIANVDMLCSFAEVSVKNNYTRPIINKKVNAINIKNGRHPVIEALLGQNEFIGNDTYIDNEDRTHIITGPNMAGKSTYMRQVALITLMAHIGCFVPADKAEIALTDKIFTRVGAGDNLTQGQSTFMLEMIEVANILNNATENSLLILDEIGRGTSTIDGLSIAWAIMEYITDNIKAKTLLATHFHELTEMENFAPHVKNFRILVKEENEKIVFLYKIKRGGTNKSFGIEVAGLAGVKKPIIKRAKAIMLSLLSSHEYGGNLREKLKNADENSENNVADYSDAKNIMLDNLLKALGKINPADITPIEAISLLAQLKDMTEGANG
jgi:DNA mismatch repair protein MutS